MSEPTSTKETLTTKFQKLTRRLGQSPLISWFINLPPLAWLVTTTTRVWLKRKIGQPPSQKITSVRVTKLGLEDTLQGIVEDVVTGLGYVGAMVAPYEQGDSLPVRAFYVDPRIASEEQIREWEVEISKYTPQPISITNPDIARAYRYDDRFKENLSVQAIETAAPIVSDELYDLFRPVAPPISRPVVKAIQEALGIQQVIAIPFFLETLMEGQPIKQVVGNLFAAKLDKITPQDELILSTFGRQAAAAIESERRRVLIQSTQELVYLMQTYLQNEAQILQYIVEGIVSKLGYTGAMVATYEPDDSLPVRAFYVDPRIASEEQIREWEAEISKYTPQPISITNPDIARAYRYDDRFKENLSIRAIEEGKHVTSDELYDLFRPVAPPVSRPVVKAIQEALGIQRVIAIPFFLETLVEGQPTKQVVGNLFAATRSRVFSSGEIELLELFGLQAAVGIRNARLYRKIEELYQKTDELYRKSEDRREQAQVFAKMAFSSAAYVHALRNHIGAFRMYFQMVKSQLNESFQELGSDVLDRLNQAANILDNLHEPWREQPDSQTDVNKCLNRAIDKIIPDREVLQAREGIVVHMSLAEDLPEIQTSPDMLTEAFRVLVKNAIEAIREKMNQGGIGGNLWVESRSGHDSTVEILIRDSGIGIKPENLGKIFELKWSTKDIGIGFGLFWTKDYVEGLGGAINVESVWQEGTTFQICLPALVG